MASGLMNPPKWDEKSKDFELWLREANAWKVATSGVASLKDVHGLQLALHLPEGSEIRRQIFDSIDTDDMKGDDGWKKIIDLFKKHYSKDDNTTAFQTWKEFRTLSRTPDQSIDQYIMCYEQYKIRMKRYKMDLGERIHGLNILCGANLSDDELRIAMREVDNDKPAEMYEQAKRSLKKYYGSSAITNASMNTSDSLTKVIKQEPLYVDPMEYDSYISWRQRRGRFERQYVSNRMPESFANSSASRIYKSPPQIKKLDGKTNPIGRNGQPLQCRVCSSIAHFERYCPHRRKSDNYVTESNLVSQIDIDHVIECKILDIYVGDALNHMILDTGCPHNVAGKVWVECFLEGLSDEDHKLIKKSPSTSKFKFGGGRVLESFYKIDIPVLVAGSNVIMSFDVVDSDIPLLLGKKSMKEWHLVIHASSDTAEFILNGETKHVELFTSKSGHWCIEVQPNFPIEAISSVMFSVENLSKKEKMSVAEHLHRQFCHPPYNFLRKVLKNFGHVDKEFLDSLQKYSSECIVCKRYKPTIPKPAVGNLFDPQKMKFNQMVSIDLKERKGRLIMYMIDVVTRYTRAVFIKCKKKEVVVDMIIQLWLSIFGAANIFLMDNGGEFANDEMRELGNQFGINIKHTAAYAPWANGVNERNHATIDNMMDKMLEDSPKLSEETALQYAVSIRNCCMYVDGFTPAQLAIGQNPKLPSAFNDELPALEGMTTSTIIAEHLNTIASARKAFALAQTSAKLKKALKKPIRSFCDVVYNQGDNVFYKLPNEHRWQGPAVVIGCEGKVILVRHGSVLRRVHPCRLQHVGLDSLHEKVDDNIVENNSSSNTETDVSQLDSDIGLQDISTVGNVDLSTNHQDEVDVRCKDTQNIQLPKKNQYIQFKYPDSEWMKIKVTGRAGKATGKAKNWLNVSDGEKFWSLDWSDVDDWKVLDEADGIEEITKEKIIDSEGMADTAVCNENVVDSCLSDKDGSFCVGDNSCNEMDNLDDISMLSENEVLVGLLESDDHFTEAKLDELKKWEKFQVYDTVKDVGQKNLTGRWVCTEKITAEGKIPKARFVVRGFQEKTNIQADSPTGSKECMRVAFMIVATSGWTLHSLDIKSAFLQGKQINRTVYLVPPREAHVENKLWKLKKCVYGLNDAARMWYFSVWEKLEELGCMRSSVDYGMFMWYEGEKLAGLIELHVDDFLWAGHPEFEICVIVPLCAAFHIGSHSSTKFTHLGLMVSQKKDHIELDQIDYINHIEPIHITRERQCTKKEFCTELESFQYRQLVGKLNWISSQSHPDIAFNVCMLSSTMKCPKVENVLAANKVLWKIKEQPLKLKFPNLADLRNIQLICFSDASLANLPSGRSTGGYLLFAASPNGTCCPIMWKSHTLKRVVRSTIAAETSAMIDALDSAYFIGRVLNETLYSKLEKSRKSSNNIPIIAYTDNESLYKNALSTTMAEEHRLRVDLSIIKEMLAKGELLKLTWIPSSDQLADCLTKRGANSIHLMRTLENGHFAI